MWKGGNHFIKSSAVELDDQVYELGFRFIMLHLKASSESQY